VRTHPVLAPALDRLAATWSFDAFTHGDLKFENCVISSGGAAQTGEGPVRIVDWELADFGDPCWDAGCVVQAYLYTCLRPLLGGPGAAPWERFGRAAAALGGFWRRYADGLEIAAAVRAATLERVLGCAAARLVQMALEVMHGQGEPPPIALSLLAAGAEILTSPREAASRLGLPESPVVSAPSGAPRSGG
jgi:aminoglycoside phosphotransferase (APT) family kinase protein